MSILFFGDIAIPFRDSINIDDVIHITRDKTVIADLEGPIIHDLEIGVFNENKYNLYTDFNCIDYFKALNISFLSLANNHSLDFKQSTSSTIQALIDNNIGYFGTSGRKYIEFNDSGKRICVWGTVNSFTGPVANNYDRLNEFKPKKLLKQLENYKIQNPEAYLVVYLHWGYELASYPHPADREWAMRAIDIGVDAVIGLHPHIVQGIEWYNNGLIVYSLGNFLLPQVAFVDRVLSFHTSKVNHEIGVEIIPTRNEIIIHKLFYDKTNSKLQYMGESAELERDYTPFLGLTVKQYQKWYKKHRNYSKDISWFNIQPTFKSYFRFQKLGYYFYKVFLIFFGVLRISLIKIGLHTPYNWKD